MCGVVSRFPLFAGAAPMLFIPLLALSAAGDDYCGMSRKQYVTGGFNPATVNCFSSLNKTGIPTANRTQYLRHEAASALKRLYENFKKDNPGVPFIVRSSTRSFSDQKNIWDAKWDKLSAENIKGISAARRILRYSSMPGASRHHWGTEIDINELNNAYYSRGRGKIVFDWMNKNAAEFGFCRPYTEGREKGYAEERWHWSYIPLSSIFLAGWNAEYAGDKKFFYKEGDFKGKIYSAERAHEFVNSINGECK